MKGKSSSKKTKKKPTTQIQKVNAAQLDVRSATSESKQRRLLPANDKFDLSLYVKIMEQDFLNECMGDGDITTNTIGIYMYNFPPSLDI